MEKEEIRFKIKSIAKEFGEKVFGAKVQVISHFDTDGITSASIMAKTLKELDISFSLKIMKNLEKEFIEAIPKNNIVIFLDLASGSLEEIKNAKIREVFIIDHHEIPNYKVSENIRIINPEINKKEF